MTIRLFVFSFFVLLSKFLIAQTENYLVQGLDRQIEIKYSKNKNNNLMIAMVAKAKSLPVDATILKYNVKEHQRIDKNNNNLQLQLSIGNFVFPDEVKYQKFDINRFLTPSLISYTYVWSYANDQVIETKQELDQKFKNGAFLLKKNVLNNYETTEFKLYLSQVDFGFDENDVTKLQEFMTTVDAYYNADARLNLMEQELDKIRNDSIEMLELYRQATIDNIKVLNQIRSERFASKLDLDANDPIQFKSHFGRAEVRNREIKKEIEKTIDNMHVTYYLKGKDWLKWNDENRAIDFFNKSMAEKASYAPPHFELAQINFKHKNYKQAIDTCSYILNKLKPDTDTRYNTVKLAESVIYVYIDEINKFISENEFIAAMEKLNACENYAKSIPGVKNFAEFDAIHGKLFKAYYMDMVNITSQLIKQDQLDQAQFNVDSLAEFRSLHSNYILNPEQEHILLKNLYAAWVAKGKNYMEKEVPDSSLYAFTQAFIVCHKHEVVYCTDELNQYLEKARIGQYEYMLSQAGTLIQDQLADSAITLLNQAELFQSRNNLEKSPRVSELLLQAQQLRYNNLISSGHESFLENKSREALAFYDEALAIEKNNKIISDTSLQGKVIQAAQSYITLLCIQGETLVEALHVTDARQKLDAAQNIYTYYNLLTDSISTQTIAALKEKLQEGKCDKIQYSFNIQIIAAKKFIDQKEFIYAWQAIENAKKLKQSNTDCNIIDTTNKQLISDVRNMLQYQKQSMKISEELEEKNYSDAIDDYKKLTRFYADSCKNNFGILHKDLYAFIATNKNTGLIDFAVQYYTMQGETDTALLLLDKLYELEYISSWSKTSQEILGKQLALKDIEAESELDAKIQVMEYTKANKWYNYLKKAYLKERKNK